MLGRKGFRITVIPITVILLLSLFLATMVVAATTSSQVMISSFGSISNPDVPSTTGLPNADYYVIAYNSLYFAINGSNQQSFLANGNAASVVNTVISKMRAGQSIVINGSISLDASIWPISNIYLDLRNATFQATVGGLTQIYIYGSPASHLTNITINGGHFIGRNDTGERGVRGYYADGCSVIGGIYENIGGGSPIDFDIGVNNLIQNNTILNNPGSYTIVLNQNTGSIITRNYIDCGGNGSGVGIFSYTNTDINCQVSYNTILNWGQNPDQGYGVLWHAVYVAGTPNTIVSSNIMSSTSPSGGVSVLIKSLNTCVYNNTLSSASSWGMDIYQEDSMDYCSPNGTQVYNNTFDGLASGGIHIGTANGYSVSNISVSSNNFSNLSTCIMIEGSSASVMVINTMIQGNVFSDSSYGIRAGWSGANSYVNGLNVLNNSFTSISPGVAVLLELGTINAQIAYNVFSSCATNILDRTGSASIHDNLG